MAATLAALLIARAAACAAADRLEFTLNTNATTGPAVSRMLYGMNVARWDMALFPSTSTQMLLTCDREAIARLRGLEPSFLKYPGGNDADSYVWNSPANGEADMNTEEFLWLARTCGTPGFFTVNFTQPPELAAEWVRYINDRFRSRATALDAQPVPFWEVGDEVWGSWAKSHCSGGDYARKFNRFAAAMRAVDPTLRLAANLDLAGSNSGWTREALRELGDSFDIVTTTFFPQSPPNETDAALLASPDQYRRMFLRLEADVAAARPGRRRPAYCLVGFNSTSTKPGPQSVEMVNAVFMAQMYGALAETGTDMACWWAFRNAWARRGGDYGVVTSDGRNTPHYSYWVMQMCSRRFHGRLVAAERRNGVELYATRQTSGSVCLLMVNTATTPSPEIGVRVTPAHPLGDWKTACADTVDSGTLAGGPAPCTVTRGASADAIGLGTLPPYSVTTAILDEPVAQAPAAAKRPD